jgi:hypothetical protein
MLFSFYCGKNNVVRYTNCRALICTEAFIIMNSEINLDYVYLVLADSGRVFVSAVLLENIVCFKSCFSASSSFF